MIFKLSKQQILKLDLKTLCVGIHLVTGVHLILLVSLSLLLSGLAYGELSARMRGDNPLHVLFNQSVPLAASHQKRLFNATVEGEIVLDYLRTLSPLSVMNQILLPFLGASCYILEHIDPQTNTIPTVIRSLSKLKTAVHDLSLLLDGDGELNMDSLNLCEERMQEAEAVATKASALLGVTGGDVKLTEALLENGYCVDLSESLQSSRDSIVRLISERLEQTQSDASEYEVWSRSRCSAEDASLDAFVEPLGNKA